MHWSGKVWMLHRERVDFNAVIGIQIFLLPLLLVTHIICCCHEYMMQGQVSTACDRRVTERERKSDINRHCIILEQTAGMWDLSQCYTTDHGQSLCSAVYVSTTVGCHFAGFYSLVSGYRECETALCQTIYMPVVLDCWKSVLDATRHWRLCHEHSTEFFSLLIHSRPKDFWKVEGEVTPLSGCTLYQYMWYSFIYMPERACCNLQSRWVSRGL